MSNSHGSFLWYELITPDAHAAIEFYASVVGWSSRAMEGVGNGYSLLSAGSADVAGVLPTPTEATGMPPAWFAYLAVDDADRAVDEIIAAGGTVHVPPTDIPGIGRFSFLADPQGALFYVMRGEQPGESTSFSPDAVGHCNWNELATDDPDAGFGFYAARFGWKKEGSMPMGAMGDYEFLSHDNVTFGAQMRRRPGGPRSRWTFYFGVSDIDQAHAAVESGGGTVQFGPDQIPGGLFAVVATDPQGAAFGLVGPRLSR